MIQVNNLTKSFGRQILLENISFSIAQRERIGLVGRNGHGKTTLIKIIIGEDHADSGDIRIPGNYTLGHVSQSLSFSRPDVVSEGCLGLPEDHRDESWRVEKILSGLGFTKADMKREPSKLSGGYQIRLNLAKTLVSEPKLLLLDEPTNYLDIVAIRWLEGFLRQWPGEFILVTHDRSFMDSVITHTLGIHRKKVRKIEGDTQKYYTQIARDEEIHEKTRQNDEKKRKEVELFVSRFRAKARLAGLVQSRIKALEKQSRLDKLDKIEALEFSFNYEPFPARNVMTISNIEFSYTGEPMITNLSMTVGGADRICVIGKNGRGKTTLLRILSSDLKPANGSILSHPSLKIGYFAQTNTQNLNPGLSVEEEIMASGADRQKARDICGSMMFSGDMALKKISVLSGGEKSRVLLGKILASPSNLLLLDEPTNHLDMDSSDTLLAAVDAFPGAVIMVTHNEMFLHSIANRFIVFQSRGCRVFEGTYQRFLEKIGWEDEALARQGLSAKPDEISCRKDIRKLKAEIISNRSKALRPIETRMAAAEKEINESEKKLNHVNDELIKASQNANGNIISSLSKEHHQLRGRIDCLYDELEKLTNEHERLQSLYDSEIASFSESA